MGFIGASPGTSDFTLDTAPGWYWDTPGKPLKGWTLSTSNWRLLLPAPPVNIAQLNSRWDVTWDELQWRQLCQKLWLGWGHPRTKFLLWHWTHCLDSSPNPAGHSGKYATQLAPCAVTLSKLQFTSSFSVKLSIFEGNILRACSELLI
jgi:hypothetical protein